MFEIDVPMHMFIISQIIGLVVTAIVIYAMVVAKKKTVLLLCFAIANALIVFNRFFLEDWVGTGLAIVAVVRNVVFLFNVKYRHKIPKWVSVAFLVLFMVADVLVVAFLWDDWFNWVALAVVIFMSICNWTTSMHLTRAGSLTYNVVFFIHGLAFANIMNMVVNAFIALMTIAFYIRFFITKKNKSQIQEARETSENPETQEVLERPEGLT